MVSNRIGLEYKYDFSSPKFRTAFEFLSRKDLGSLPLGWIDLDNGVRASVQGYETIAPAEGFYETHEKYFDIQYVVSGKEYVGVTTRDGLKVKTPYDKDGDITSTMTRRERTAWSISRTVTTSSSLPRMSISRGLRRVRR